ncbi:NlpC/P60 family protein [Streptomyces montanus]|uniref:NlpC/P60 family protein n=1 Tax=Streptomyces montanus TaxID=2580423 RepID=A0A5R9FN83_9ACTN|nr:peptidoglycan-binding protein [Streptomyces montanus]TLS44781.1 NlpC/P60 family protein [Streptomyces montanus]
MAAPAFEEFDPASDCDCPGCVHWRRVRPHSLPGSFGGHPAAHRALVVAAVAGTALGAGQAVPAVAVTAAHAPLLPGVVADEEPDTPQGSKAPLHGPAGAAATAKAPLTTRAEIINRAKKWVAAKVPYNIRAYWSDGYRQDCSGFVSMAWNLGANEWTGSLAQYGVRISRSQLQPGDILLFHNPADPQKGSHVVIFGGWTDYTQTHYLAYEEVRPRARGQATPFAYWSQSNRYVAYRYKGLRAAGTGGASPGASSPSARAYPGRAAFGPGANNAYVTQLGRMLVKRGAGPYYTSGPGPRWTDADRRATRAFQLAQGWRGADADGLPGPTTWSYLVNGKGKDIRAGSAGSAGKPGGAGSTGSTGKPLPPAGGVASHGVPGYPGRSLFRPGANNAYVTQLGRQLVKKGFGKYYTSGPGPRWSEADRRNVEAFQRSQGWRGGAADGYPGPETWRRLFS